MPLHLIGDSPVAAHSPPPAHLTQPPSEHTTSFLVQRTRRHSLISFEVFPPRPGADDAAVWRSLETMAEAGPDFFSVTHGHNQIEGANRLVIRRLRARLPVPVLAHLICEGSTTAEMRAQVHALLDDGVRDILALRGDPPAGSDAWVYQRRGLNRAAELIRLIREVEDERFCPGTGPGARPISIAAAAYPPSGTERSYEGDLRALWEKQQSGADYAITQVVYDAESYARLVDDARSLGIHLPIVAGLAPLTNPRRLTRLQEITCVPVPAELVARLDTDDPALQRRIAIAETMRLIDELLELGCPGFHLFTFNQHPAAVAILDHLRIRDAARRRATASHRTDLYA